MEYTYLRFFFSFFIEGENNVYAILKYIRLPSYCSDNSWMGIVSVDGASGRNSNCSGQKLNYDGNATY